MNFDYLAIYTTVYLCMHLYLSMYANVLIEKYVMTT